MPKTKELTVAERAQIVLLSTQGCTQSEIARRMKCSRCAVQTTLKRYKETGTYENRAKSGRKRRTSYRTDRYLYRIALKNRRKSSKELSSELWIKHGISLSSSTVRRRLRAANLHGRIARRKPYLTQAHRKKRLEWAKKYAHWTVEDWSRVIFSDESNIEVCFLNGYTL